MLAEFLNRNIMPLVHSEQIDANSTLLLWSLTETESELRALLGSPYNFEDLVYITHPQKVREWLASRLLLKYLAEKFGIYYEGTHKDEHGKAFLVNNDSHISLTHTAAYVAAVMHRHSPVGIDMEKMSEKLIRTARKFLSPAEEELGGSDIKRLCMYWSAKEALYKMYGKKKISFKEAIYIHPFSDEDQEVGGTLTDSPRIISARIRIFWLEDYCLAIAL